MTRWVALAAADVAVLVALRPTPLLVRQLAHPAQWIASVGSNRAGATLGELALWAVAAWVGVGLLAMLASMAPGALGRTASAVARHVLPRTLRRFVAGSVGLGVLLTPIAATAAPDAASVAPATAPSRPVGAAVPTPSWPVGAPVPSPAWPALPAVAERQHRPPAHRQTTHRQTTHRHPHRRDPGGRDADRTARRAALTVRPGDTLWTIAAEQLPAARRTSARIAASWPRWYAANRAVIGDDPGVIQPGQQLRPPSSAEEPAS